jgi:hypothetical protein
MQKIFFEIATLYRKIGRKITFDFGGLYTLAAKEVFWENKFSFAPASIFIIKVHFPHN